MKKKYCLLVFGALLFGLFLSSPVFAHTFEQDGSTGVLLHVDPNDEPTVGQPSTINFSVEDTSHSFSFEKCACQLKVTLGDKTLRTLALDSSSLIYTFERPGTYHLILSGEPINNASFEPFSVTFDDLKVNPSSDVAARNQSVFSQAIILAIVGIALLGGLVYLGLYSQKT